MRQFLFAGIAGLISSVAFAAAPNWAGFAGLVDADKDGYPAFVGTSTAASTGYSGKDDCDDTDKSVYPGASEIVADGIDQNCSGADLVLPVADPAYKRYVANSYGGRAPKPETFVAEFNRCKNATGRCTVNDVKGTFVVTNPEVDAFRDIYQGTGKILGADGVREVVTLEEASHFRGGSASGGGSGISTKTATKIADKAVKAETDARLAWQANLEADFVGPMTKNTNEHTGLIADNAKAIEDEVGARESADNILSGRISTASANASNAVATANSVASHGPLIEAYALTGLVAGSPVTGRDGEGNARDVFGGGAGAGLNFGADLESARVNGFVDFLVGVDGGAGPAHSEAVGAEIIGEDGIGGFLAYSQRSTQVNSLQTQIVGRNPLVGLSVALPFAEDYERHSLFQARIGCGPDFIGIATDGVEDWVAFACRATIGVGGGIGALQ
ncbi:MAG: putative metal-binding motif-containing protein [Patescibacteria group bacterium]